MPAIELLALSSARRPAPSRSPRGRCSCPVSRGSTRGAIYQVRQPITIAGEQLRPMQEFTFDVSAEEMGEGGEFTRRLLLGPFHPTARIDYCNPGEDD